MATLLYYENDYKNDKIASFKLIINHHNYYVFVIFLVEVK